MDDFNIRLAKRFGYDIEMLVNPSVRYESMPGKGNEPTFLVKSQSVNRNYRVKLRNAAKKGDDVVTKLDSLRNLKHDCECGKGEEKDLICAIPAEFCVSWGIPYEEYARSRNLMDKIYGEVICKHEARVLEFLEYPLFNRHLFHQKVFPFVVRDLGKLEGWKQEDIDAVVLSNLHRMNGFKVFNYIKQLNYLDEILRDIQRLS